MPHPLVSDILEHVLENNSWPETFPAFEGKFSDKYIINKVFVATVVLTPQNLKYFLIYYLYLVVLFIPSADFAFS
jgi:hypothetical protein